MTTVKKKLTLNNKQHLQVLRKQIDVALALVSEEYDLHLKMGHCTYDSDGTGCTFKVEVRALDDTGTVISKQMQDLIRHEKLLELPEDWQEMTFSNRGDRYKIVGFKPGSPKFCMVCQNIVTQKTLLFTDDIIKILRKLP